MSRRHLAYNPALLTNEELHETFVVRQVDLQLIVETIRDNDGPSNQHVVVVGARGMGKTTLVSRVALAVNQDPALSQRWTPVLFGEESYDVGSVGELWLKALERLAETVVDDPRWREAFEAVREEKDEERLRERALGRLLDYARDSHTRILLVVENLDMMLGEQIEPDDAWTLRHTLQQHSEIMLLATAVDYESTFGRRDLPLYRFAREHRLRPLTLSETRELWARVANEERPERAMIPIHRLTGGNTRLVTIVASFSAGRSFRELMDELTALVDEHTSYFKATIEALPPTERRVYSTLADIWAPATSRQVAERCRMSTSKTSALLARLVARRMVEEIGKDGRSKRYQLVERLYNVYHVLRSRGGEQRARLKGLVEFMAMFYESDDLADIMGKLALEATALPDGDWGEYLEAYVLLMEKLPDHRQLLRATPDLFLARLFEPVVPSADFVPTLELMKAQVDILDSSSKVTAARAIRALAAYFEINASQVVDHLLNLLTLESSAPGAPPMFEEFRTQFLLPFTVRLLPWIGDTSKKLSGFESLHKAFPLDRDVLVGLTFGLGGVGRVDEALIHARTLAETFPDDAKALALLGHVLEAKGDYTRAAAAYRRSLEESDEPRVRLRLAAILCRTPGHIDEARHLASTVAFEDGEIPQWLMIAQAEEDPEHAVAIARQILLTADLTTGLVALEVIVNVLNDARIWAVLKDTIRIRPESPAAAICMVLVLRRVAQKPVEDSWSLLRQYLRHPQWKEEAFLMASMAASVILHFGRVDPARVLAMLVALDGGAATSPVVVALRMSLGGDVADVPAEVVDLARDLIAKLDHS